MLMDTGVAMPLRPPSIIVVTPQDVVVTPTIQKNRKLVTLETTMPDLGCVHANTAPVNDPISKNMLQEAARNPSLMHRWAHHSTEVDEVASPGAGLSTPGKPPTSL